MPKHLRIEPQCLVVTHQNTTLKQAHTSNDKLNSSAFHLNAHTAVYSLVDPGGCYCQPIDQSSVLL